MPTNTSRLVLGSSIKGPDDQPLTSMTTESRRDRGFIMVWSVNGIQHGGVVKASVRSEFQTLNICGDCDEEFP